MFETSFYERSSQPMFPQNFTKIIPPPNETTSSWPRRKNMKKMPQHFFMTADIQQTILKLKQQNPRNKKLISFGQKLKICFLKN